MDIMRKIKCLIGWHSWGPKYRYSMYIYVEKCKYCPAKLYNSGFLTITEEK